MRCAHLRHPPCRVLLDQSGRLRGRGVGAGIERRLSRTIRVEQQAVEQVEHRTGATELRDALGAAMRIFIRRMIGAALLSRRVYEAVEADRHATGQALAVVLLASVGTGVGWVGVEPGRAWAMVVLDRLLPSRPGSPGRS